MSRLTLGIVGRTLFSRNLDDAADEFGRTLSEVLALMNDRAMRFLPSPLWWPTSLQPPARTRDRASLDRVVFDIIEARRRSGEAHERSPRHAAARARRGDRRGDDRPPAARRGHDVPAGRPRDDGGRAQLDVVPARPPSVESSRSLRAEVSSVLGGRAPDGGGPAAPAATPAWWSRRRCVSIRRCGASSARRSAPTRSASYTVAEGRRHPDQSLT